jgi:sterol desaturase/sphingolipid hydroxylase (fatty acid hydroxylase superfamily)
MARDGSTASASLRPLRTLIRYGFVPALLVGAVFSWIEREPLQTAFKARGFRLDFATSLLLALIAGVWVAEHLAPARADWNDGPLTARSGGFWRDLLYLFVITQFSALFIAMSQTPLKAALATRGFAFDTSHLWPTELAFPLKVLLAFFIVEFFSYWLHRAAHAVPLLWQFHATHHVVTELNGLKALRTHPVENALFALVRTVPLLLVGAGAEEVLTASTFGAMMGVLSHANLELSTFGVGLVVNLPGYHRVHHSAELDESNSNFGCHTIFWDRVFRTFRPAPREPLTIGVKPVGPRSLWSELFWPFYRRVS